MDSKLTKRLLEGGLPELPGPPGRFRRVEVTPEMQAEFDAEDAASGLGTGGDGYGDTSAIEALAQTTAASFNELYPADGADLLHRQEMASALLDQLMELIQR